MWPPSFLHNHATGFLQRSWYAGKTRASMFTPQIRLEFAAHSSGVSRVNVVAFMSMISVYAEAAYSPIYETQTGLLLFVNWSYL